MPRRASPPQRPLKKTPLKKIQSETSGNRDKHRRRCWDSSERSCDTAGFELDQGRLQDHTFRGGQAGRLLRLGADPGARYAGFSGSEVCRRIFAADHIL